MLWGKRGWYLRPFPKTKQKKLQFIRKCSWLVEALPGNDESRPGLASVDTANAPGENLFMETKPQVKWPRTGPKSNDLAFIHLLKMRNYRCCFVSHKLQILSCTDKVLKTYTVVIRVSSPCSWSWRPDRERGTCADPQGPEAASSLLCLHSVSPGVPWNQVLNLKEYRIEFKLMVSRCASEFFPESYWPQRWSLLISVTFKEMVYKPRQSLSCKNTAVIITYLSWSISLDPQNTGIITLIS